MRRQGFPKKYELVVCRITKINPNSAYANLIEYEKSGLIHASEVAKRWVKNIKEFLKEEQFIICRVMDIDLQRNTINLSVKRVHRDEAKRKLTEFKKERKAEKFMEMAAESVKKTLNQAYEEIGYQLQEEFGSIGRAFEISLKNPELFNEKVPKKWAEVLTDIAKKNYSEKIHQLQVELKLICYRPDGIAVIRKALSKVSGFELKYISAPKYLLVGKGKDFKKLRAEISEEAEKITKEINSQRGDCSYKLLEK